MRAPKYRHTVIVVFILIVCLFFARYLWEKEHPTRYPPSALGSDIPTKTELQPETFLTLGKNAEEGFRYQDALVFYRLGAQFFPTNIPMLEGEARVQMALANRTAALDILSKAAVLDPGNARLQALYAELLYELQHYKEAQGPMERAARLQPNNKHHWLMLARIAALNEDYTYALTVYDFLKEKYPDDQELTAAVLKMRAWSKEKTPKDHSSLILNRLREAFNAKNNARAEELEKEYAYLFGYTMIFQEVLTVHIYRSLLEKKPNDAETWYRLAVYYYTNNKTKEALDPLQHAIALSKHNFEYLQLYTYVTDELNLNKERLEAYSTMLALRPGDPAIIQALAVFQAVEDTSMTEKQIKQNPILLDAVTKIYEKKFLESYAILQNYAKNEGQNPLYQSLLAFLASQMDRNLLCCITDEKMLAEFAQLFITTGLFQRDVSYLFQEKAELIGNCLAYREPCSIDYLTLYSNALRMHEDPPFVDLVATQRTYCRILSIDPYNQDAWRSLGRIAKLLKNSDEGAEIYQWYLSNYPPDRQSLTDVADLLEDQGNIGKALDYLELYRELYGCDKNYKLRRAHILNSGELSTPAYPIALELVKEDQYDYDAWVDYTNAAANLHYLDASYCGLAELEELSPGNPETDDARWNVIPRWTSTFSIAGEFYQDTTSLTEYVEKIKGAYLIRPGLQFTAGIDTFQTYASNTNIGVLGIGDLVGINGEKWGSEGDGWIGSYWQQDPNLFIDARIGVARQNVGTLVGWSPTYFLDFYMPVCDNLKLDYFSEFGYLNYLTYYSYFQQSPRSLSLNIRQWRHFFSFDWMPSWGNQLIITAEGHANTDGNKQLLTYVYPRHTVLFLKHWKLDVGLMGNWYTSTKGVPDNGYYSPYLYQAYAVELLLDYKFNYRNTLKINGTLGTQKDNFSTRFGFLGEIQCEGLFDISPCWSARIFGDYYYLDTSDGYFSYLDFAGGITRRF